MKRVESYGSLEGRTVAVHFSGGLDTSFCVAYLQKEYGARVLTVAVDTGGFTPVQLNAIEQRSRELGAAAGHRTVDATARLWRDFLVPLIHGNVLRGGSYLLSAAAERVAQAIEVAAVAREVGAVAVVHGSTGAGNDQIRFDVAFAVIAPDLPCLAPIRDSGLGRPEETEYLGRHGIAVPPKTTAYSMNEGLWGTTISGRETHGSWEEVPEHLYPGTPPNRAPEGGQVLTLSFDAGLPVAVDGRALDGVALVRELNRVGGSHGVGRGVHLGDTILGIKGRVAFAAPGPQIVVAAHRELEKLVLTGWQAHWKEQVGAFYGQLLHNGLWFDPVMRDIEAHLKSSQQRVTGDVRLRLCRGVADVLGVKSRHSLMDPDVAVYGEGMKFWSGEEARGFARLWGLQSVLWSRAGGKAQ